MYAKISLYSFRLLPLRCALALFIFCSAFITNAAAQETLSDTLAVQPEEPEGQGGVEKKGDSFFTERTDTLSVVERKIPEEEVRKLKSDKAYWYADASVHRDRSGKLVTGEMEKGRKSQKQENEQGITEQKTETPYLPLGQRPWFQVLLWFLMVGVFVAGIVFYLSGSNIGLFRRKNKRTGAFADETETTEDIFSIRYASAIEKAEAAGNFRLAVRLRFLQLLKELADKNIIRYQQDKTNFDYLSELQPTRYYTPFFRLTRNYEYCWYGQFPVSGESYTLLRNDFQQFAKQLTTG